MDFWLSTSKRTRLPIPQTFCRSKTRENTPQITSLTMKRQPFSVLNRWKVADALTLGLGASFSAWLQNPSIFYPFFNQQKLPVQKRGGRHKGKWTRQQGKYSRSQGEQVSEAEKRIPKKSSARNNGLRLLQAVFPKDKLTLSNLTAFFLNSLFSVSAAHPFTSYTMHFFNLIFAQKCRGKAHEVYGFPKFLPFVYEKDGQIPWVAGRPAVHHPMQLLDSLAPHRGTAFSLYLSMPRNKASPGFPVSWNFLSHSPL